MNDIVCYVENIENINCTVENTAYVEKPVTQEKTVTPTKQVQTVIPDTGYNGLSKVTVNKIPDDYIIPTGEITIAKNGTYDVKDKAVAKVETSGVDLNDYFILHLDSLGSGGVSKFNEYLIKKLPAISFNGELFNAVYKDMRNITECDFTNVDFSNTTVIDECFSGCRGLEEIDLRKLDGKKLYSMRKTFYQCSKLKTIHLENCSFEKVTIMNDVFWQCSLLENLYLKENHNYGKAFEKYDSENYYNYTLTFQHINNLTHESLMNIINGLYDIATAGVKPQKLILGTTNLAKLTSEEIAIATNKGWTVS